LKLPTRPQKRSSRTRPILLDKDALPVNIEGKVDIILLPSLYWFREEVLPAKNTQQAKKLAPSLFDAVIPEGVYSYHAQKRGDGFWLFAYDELQIASSISDAGLRPSQVQSIYFAQNECAELQIPLEIDSEQVLVNNEGVLCILPSRYVDKKRSVEDFLRDLKLSKEKVSVNLFKNSLLDEKQINYLTAIVIIFIIIYTAAFLMEKHHYKQILIKEHALVEHYGLPETSFQLEGLKSSLENKQKRQIKIRKKLKELFEVPLKNNEYIKSFEASMKKVSYEIVMNDAKRAEAIKKILQKNIKITSAKVKNKIFYVSGSYE
jgi:hypothetical protein